MCIFCLNITPFLNQVKTFVFKEIMSILLFNLYLRFTQGLYFPLYWTVPWSWACTTELYLEPVLFPVPVNCTSELRLKLHVTVPLRFVCMCYVYNWNINLSYACTMDCILELGEDLSCSYNWSSEFDVCTYVLSCKTELNFSVKSESVPVQWAVPRSLMCIMYMYLHVHCTVKPYNELYLGVGRSLNHLNQHPGF